MDRQSTVLISKEVKGSPVLYHDPDMARVIEIDGQQAEPILSEEARAILLSNAALIRHEDLKLGKRPKGIEDGDWKSIPVVDEFSKRSVASLTEVAKLFPNVVVEVLPVNTITEARAAVSKIREVLVNQREIGLISSEDLVSGVESAKTVSPNDDDVAKHYQSRFQLDKWQPVIIRNTDENGDLNAFWEEYTRQNPPGAEWELGE